MRARGLVVAAAAVALIAGSVAEARSALRGLAVAHGSEHYEGDGGSDSGARFTPAHDESEHESDTWEWKELSEVTGADADAEMTTTRDVKTPTDDHDDDASEIHEEDPDDAPSDIAHDADVDADVDGSAETDDAETEDAASKSFDFEAIAGEAQSDDVAGVVPADSRGVSGGYSSGGVAQKVGTPAPSVATVPIGESAAAAKPISEISASAIQRDPEAYGVVTPAPSVAAVPIGESAAAAKPISEISPAAIQKDPVGYGVVTPAPSTPKPVPIGESAAAAKPVSDIDPSAIQRDPKSYGVATPVPGTTTMKLADSPMAASKPTATPAPAAADKSPTQKAF